MRHWILALSLGLVAAGCVTQGEKERLETSIFDLKTRLLQMETRLKGGSEQQSAQTLTLANSSSKVDKLELELRRIQGAVDALQKTSDSNVLSLPDSEKSSNEVSASDPKFADLEQRIQKLEDIQKILVQALEQKKSAANSSRVTRTERTITYAHLMSAFKSRKYKKVAEDAPVFLSKTKDKSKKAEILFVSAESLFKLGQLRDAALKYNEFIEAGAKDHLAHAKMRMGDCFRHLGDKDTAKLYYQDLVKQFPSTAEAKKAKDRLAKL